MKLAVVLLACLGVVVASYLDNEVTDVKYAKKSRRGGRTHRQGAAPAIRDASCSQDFYEEWNRVSTESVSGCTKPLEVFVDIPEDNLYSYSPKWVKAMRCSGKCKSQECMPTNTTTARIPVKKIGLKSSGNDCAYAYVENDISCKCKCNPKSCDSKKQVYNTKRCRCECRDKNARSDCRAKAGTEWREESCDCVCKKPPHERLCYYGHTWSDDECKCVPNKSVRKLKSFYL